MFPVPDYVRQCILECALECALDLAAGKSPDRVVAAVKELDALNDQISELSGTLAAIYRQRNSLKEEFGLTDRSRDADEGAADPFRLLGALELALGRPDLLGWGLGASDELAALYSIAASQSRKGPEWADLLDEASYRYPRAPGLLDPADVAMIGGRTNKSPWSPWALRLIGALGDWAGNGLPKGFFLSCLQNSQLATLAEVAFGAPPGAFSDEQMRKLKGRHSSREQSS